MKPGPIKLDIEVSFAPVVAALREMAADFSALADAIVARHPEASDSNTSALLDTGTVASD